MAFPIPFLGPLFVSHFAPSAPPSAPPCLHCRLPNNIRCAGFAPLSRRRKSGANHIPCAVFASLLRFLVKFQKKIKVAQKRPPCARRRTHAVAPAAAPTPSRPPHPPRRARRRTHPVAPPLRCLWPAPRRHSKFLEDPHFLYLLTSKKCYSSRKTLESTLSC